MAGKKDFKVTPIVEEGSERFGVAPAPLSSRGTSGEPDMEVREILRDQEINDSDDDSYEYDEDEVEPIRSQDLRAVSGTQPGKIAISFEKFVQLLTAHDFETTMKGHKKKDIIIDIDLLADLATPQTDEEPERRIPLIFALGLLVGGVVVFILVKLLT